MLLHNSFVSYMKQSSASVFTLGMLVLVTNY
jgi:hypothetical protein